ncbi:MAG: xanthine dehydrogenase family protein subunit M [Rhizobiales bacterium]|nr:xanthine dehydrogenase family protein subunit M [Hyphomicrobiales bacterium]OJY44412.1 MAG: molybdopterin dehydrogenase [Rhizobiales bacterium 64-17]
MKPARFAYVRAASVDDAIALLGTHGDGARLLAGGQSLVATLNMRLSAPDLLIDINGIAGLSDIRLNGNTVEIGALARHAQVERSEVVARHAPLIAQAMPFIAHPAIRNRGTVGGSIALADPAAELPACVLALGGILQIAGPDGRRSVAADDFFTGLFETALGPQDMLTGVHLPAASPDRRYGFAELARRHGDYAIAGLAAAARVQHDVWHDVRLTFFGVADRPLRATAAERALTGHLLDEQHIDAAVAALDLPFTSDVQADAATRRHLAGVLLRRVVSQMMENKA